MAMRECETTTTEINKKNNLSRTPRRGVIILYEYDWGGVGVRLFIAFRVASGRFALGSLLSPKSLGLLHGTPPGRTSLNSLRLLHSPPPPPLSRFLAAACTRASRLLVAGPSFKRVLPRSPAAIYYYTTAAIITLALPPVYA